VFASLIFGVSPTFFAVVQIVVRQYYIRPTQMGRSRVGSRTITIFVSPISRKLRRTRSVCRAVKHNIVGIHADLSWQKSGGGRENAVELRMLDSIPKWFYLWPGNFWFETGDNYYSKISDIFFRCNVYFMETYSEVDYP